MTTRTSIPPASRASSFLGLALAAGGAAAGSLPGHSGGPFTDIFGLPDGESGGALLDRARYGLAVSSVTSSHNIDEMRSGEGLRLDGESTRLALEYRYGLRDGLELSLEVPYVWHQTGSLDAFIDDWHDFFGLPEGPRAERAHDELDLYYADARGAVSLTGNSHGIGDVRLGAGWRLAGSGRHDRALRVSLELPTGDSAALNGSGGTDLGIGVAGDVRALGGHADLSGYYRVDVTWLGGSDVLTGRVNDVVGQVAGGIGYRVHRAVDLRAQARVRSAVYDSGIDALGEASVTLTVGALFRLSERYELALAVGEDVKPDSAPDVSFQLALRYRGT